MRRPTPESSLHRVLSDEWALDLWWAGRNRDGAPIFATPTDATVLGIGRVAFEFLEAHGLQLLGGALLGLVALVSLAPAPNRRRG